VERRLPLQEQPLLELRRIGQRQPGEQFAPIERRGLDQAREALRIFVLSTPYRGV